MKGHFLTECKKNVKQTNKKKRCVFKKKGQMSKRKV